MAATQSWLEEGFPSPLLDGRMFEYPIALRTIQRMQEHLRRGVYIGLRVSGGVHFQVACYKEDGSYTPFVYGSSAEEALSSALCALSSPRPVWFARDDLPF